MSAYYNEIDPFAAQWLRELIKAGLIASGDVDGRSIEDVTPNDLRGYSQCHFFAGIGGWSYALRLAGWPDDRPVWTGSCPCQPFSAAGKGKGFADERHLWPSWYWLIQQCRPAIVFGEQVASKATNVWFDLVQADLEAMGYAFGVLPFPAASLGAPHIRDRAYWVADSSGAGLEGRQEQYARAQLQAIERSGGIIGLGNPSCDGRDAWRSESRRPECAPTAGEFSGMADARGVESRRRGEPGGEESQGSKPWPGLGLGVELERMADTSSGQLQEQIRRPERRDGAAAAHAENRLPRPTNGFWRDVDWLFCRDGKWRPVEPGTFPLAHGVPNRVGRLRGYGNAIVAPQAAEFIKTVMEAKS